MLGFQESENLKDIKLQNILLWEKTLMVKRFLIQDILTFANNCEIIIVKEFMSIKFFLQGFKVI